MKLHFPVLLITLFLFSACQTATHNTVAEFRKIDSSLQRSNSIITENVYHSVYKQIQQAGPQNKTIALQADTIFFSAESALSFIDSLKEELNRLDTSGIKLDIGSELLVNTDKSVELTKRINDLYVSCSVIFTEKNNQRVDVIFSIEKEIKNKDWTKTYFEMTPTVAAITVLNKIKNDCTNLAVFSLTELKSELK